MIISWRSISCDSCSVLLTSVTIRLLNSFYKFTGGGVLVGIELIEVLLLFLLILSWCITFNSFPHLSLVFSFISISVTAC